MIKHAIQLVKVNRNFEKQLLRNTIKDYGKLIDYNTKRKEMVIKCQMWEFWWWEMCGVTCLFRCESPWGVGGGPNLGIGGPGIFSGVILAGGGGCLLVGTCGQSWLVSVQLHGGHLSMCGWGGCWGQGHTCWLGRAHGMQRGTRGRPLRFGRLKRTTKITLNVYLISASGITWNDIGTSEN